MKDVILSMFSGSDQDSKREKRFYMLGWTSRLSDYDKNHIK